MSKLVVANLKTYLNDSNVKNYVKNIKKIKYNNLIICPQDKYIDILKSNNYKLGIQDYSDNYSKVDYVLLGHYDRRKNHETDELINEKINKSLSKNLKVILCVGNDIENSYERILNQLNICLKNINKNYFDNIIIAYEPYYMIGNDIDINIDLVREYIKQIKKYILENYNVSIDVLYGGNVNEKNIEEVIKICDGVLIGRVSYDINKLVEILEKI